MRVLTKKAISLVTLSAVLMASSAFLKADAAARSVTYVKYVCATNTRSEYTLSQNDAATATQTYGLVGLDDRERDGYTGIVRISSDIQGGTGFIVDDHTIATNAHVVSLVNNNEMKHLTASSYYFIPNMQVHLYNDDGTPRSTTPLTVVEMHIPKSYESGFTHGDDYALITVEEDLSELGCAQFDLGLAYNMNTASFMRANLFVTGIPGWTETDTNENTGNLVYTGKGTEAPSGLSNSVQFCYTADSTEGNSGSPVYFATRYTVGDDVYTTYTAIAIHSGAGEGDDLVAGTHHYNIGSPITSSKLQFYLSNDNIDY